MASKQPLHKLYYISPMFRQERPQAGRLRQFHQFGAEALGSESPILDAEMIQMSYEILKSLGLKNLSVKINSLGTPEIRENYKTLLKNFLKDKKDILSEDSRRRFETNILRIFDSKVESDQNLIKDAPRLIDHLDEESKADFEVVKEQLKKSGIPFEIDSSLVRGLDYYTKLTFEIDSGSVGAQTALCGGGRYDLLIETLGGKPTPATGFAAGIERILLACENEKSFTVPEPAIDIYLVRIGDEVEFDITELAGKLRKENFSVDFDYLQRSVKAQMREANKLSAKYVLFIGGDEYKEGLMNLKNMSTGVEEKVALNDFGLLITKLK